MCNFNIDGTWRSLIQFLPLWSMEDKAEAEPKTPFVKYYQYQVQDASHWQAATHGDSDGIWWEQFLVPLPLYNPVFTIVIYGW